VYALIGGVDTILGPLLGAAILRALTDQLSRAGTQSSLFIGIMLMLVVYLIPEGLLGLWRGFVRRRPALGRLDQNGAEAPQAAAAPTPPPAKPTAAAAATTAPAAPAATTAPAAAATTAPAAAGAPTGTPIKVGVLDDVTGVGAIEGALMRVSTDLVVQRTN